MLKNKLEKSRLAVITWLTALATDQAGRGMVGSIISIAIMSLVAILFIFAFVPVLEAELVTFTSANAIVSALADMAVWVIPVALLGGVVFMAIRVIRN